MSLWKWCNSNSPWSGWVLDFDIYDGVGALSQIFPTCYPATSHILRGVCHDLSDVHSLPRRVESQPGAKTKI